MNPPVVIPGGWYIAALASGEHVCLVPGRHLDTAVGPLAFPPNDQPIWLTITNRAGVKYAGQGHYTANSWEWAGGAWHPRTAACGVWALIYDRLGLLHISDCGPGVGSQGWRDVEDDGTSTGRLVPSDSKPPVHGLSEPIDLGNGFVIGQGSDVGGVVVWDGTTRRLLHAGACFAIHKDVQGTSFAIAFYEVAADGLQAYIYRGQLAELATLPLVTAPGPVVPPAKPPIDPPPVPKPLPPVPPGPVVPPPVTEPPMSEPSRGTHVWLQPNIAAPIADLTNSDILGHVQIVEFVAQHFDSDPVVGPGNAWQALLDARVFQKLHDQGIGISLGTSVLTAEDPTGARSLADLSRFVEQFHNDTGLDLGYVSLDVPMSKNKFPGVRASFDVLAKRIATFIQKAHELGLKVAWAESWPEIEIGPPDSHDRREMTMWAMFEALDEHAEGREALPNYWHLDIDHHRKVPDAPMIASVQAIKKSYGIPTAVILAGYKHATDQEYEQDVLAWARQIKTLGLPMDQLLLMSWVEGFTQPSNPVHVALLNTVVEQVFP